MSFEEFAPLKLNLFLHVTGRRSDGYHLLESLFVFANIGDRISYAPSNEPLSLNIVGPFAGQLPDDPDNLVLRAARLLRPVSTGILTLDKQVPVASGLGGGSADAAATLRLLNRVWQCGQSEDQLRQRGSKLGADVPACIASRSVYVSGIGDALHDIDQHQTLYLLLANPGIATSTPKVFAAYRTLDTGFTAPMPGWPQPERGWQQCRNDLTQAAEATTPEITQILQMLEKIPAAKLVRMSGSGASCFALFDHANEAQQAAERLKYAQPDWWVRSGQAGTPSSPI
jgi:4-diphosphocytidyl-2-C-methyl-D-erythritol kinase